MCWITAIIPSIRCTLLPISPYAVPVYHHLGFIDMDEEQTVDGMRFRPMRFERDDHGISN